MLTSEIHPSQDSFLGQWQADVKSDELPADDVPTELSQAMDFCAESLLNSPSIKIEEPTPAAARAPSGKPTTDDGATKGPTAPTGTSRKRGAAKAGGGSQKKVQKRDTVTSPNEVKPKAATSRKRRPARGALQALSGPETSISSTVGLASIVSAATSVVGRNIAGGDDSRSDAVLIIGYLRMQTHLFRLLRYTQMHFPEWADHEGSFLWHAANILGAASLVDLAAYRLSFEDATAVIHPSTGSADWPWTVFFAPLEPQSTNNPTPTFIDPIPLLDVFSVANCLAQLDNYRRKFDSTFVPIDLRETISLHISRYPRAATAPTSAFLSSAFASDPNGGPPPQADEPAPPAYTKQREDWACKVPTSFGSQPWSSSDDEDDDEEVREADDGPPKDPGYSGVLGWFRQGRGQVSADEDESSMDSEPADILASGGLNQSASNPGTLSILSMGKRPTQWPEGQQQRPATPKAAAGGGSPTSTPRTPEGAGDLEVKSAVRGVYYDETSKRWCASWHEKKSGKKRSRYFAVKKFGFMPAKKLATEARLEAEETGECAPTNLHGVEPA